MFCVCFIGGRCRLRGEFLLCGTAVPFRCVPFRCTRSHASVRISVLTSLSASGLAVSCQGSTGRCLIVNRGRSELYAVVYFIKYLFRKYSRLIWSCKIYLIFDCFDWSCAFFLFLFFFIDWIGWDWTDFWFECFDWSCALHFGMSAQQRVYLRTRR